MAEIYIQDPLFEDLIKCPQCDGPLIVKIEERLGHNKEEVAYCNNCGYTATT